VVVVDLSGQKSPPSIRLIGTQLTLFSQAELLSTVSRWIRDGGKAMVLSGNIHSFNLAYREPWLRTFMNRASVVRLDGEGLKLGAKILGIDTPPRMTWADLAWDLARLCQRQGFTLFFVGSRPGVADKAAARLKEEFSDLRIVGIHHGYFDQTSGSPENNAVISEINTARPNILIVGFGMPLQEHWLMENWDRIQVDVAFTGGAVFDYVSGELRRPPRWMTRNGLEWLGRLVIDPQRLWRRYLIGNPLFLWRVLKQRIGLLDL